MSFAVAYPFSQFETKALVLPDLIEVLGNIGVEEEAKTHSSASSFSQEQVHSDGPLYCAVTKINGKDRRIYLSESEALDPTSPYLMNPFIFYRVKAPAKNIEALPQISIGKFFEQTKSEEQVAFSIKTVQLGNQRGKKNYLGYISNEETKKNFGELMQFKTDDDRQLMRCMDKFICDEIKDKEIIEVTGADLDFKKFDLKNERLKKINKELLQMRCELFLKFTK